MHEQACTHVRKYEERAIEQEKVRMYKNNKEDGGLKEIYERTNVLMYE